jgi:hypothetical protein
MTRKDYQLIASSVLSTLRCYDNDTLENKAIKELAENYLMNWVWIIPALIAPVF